MAFRIKIGDQVRVKGDPLARNLRVVGLSVSPESVVICTWSAPNGGTTRLHTSGFAIHELSIEGEQEG